MNVIDPINFRSKAESPITAALTESVYGVLYGAVANQAESVLLDDYRKTAVASNSLRKACAERPSESDEIAQQVREIAARADQQERDALRSLILVALARFNYRASAIAPVDYPALADALDHDA